MDKISDRLLADLLLTKAMADYAVKEERFDCLNDVIDEVFADGALDREEYLTSVMELTQFGFVASDIECEEDIAMSEAVGYDIIGLTPKGIEYIDTLAKNDNKGQKIKDFFKEFDKVCGKFADSGIGKLTGTILIPILGLIL